MGKGNDKQFIVGILRYSWIFSTRMATCSPGFHYDRLHFVIFLIDCNVIGIDSLAVEIRITVRIYDDTCIILLHGYIKWVIVKIHA